MTDQPTSARAVVIGGGIVGCSTAYHLAKLGWTDTVLIERHKLTSGSTFHAAGLVGQLRSSANITQLLGYSVDLYKRLEEETGQATGWKMNGGLRLACNEERWNEVKRQATTAKSFGLEMHLLSPTEAQELWPLMTVDDVVGAAFLPTDGQANPTDITMALARGARQAGATICEDTEVLEIEVVDGVIKAVVTSQGRIECSVVVCCAGPVDAHAGGDCRRQRAAVSVQHQYVITTPFDPPVPRDLPTLRDPDRLTYYKEEVGGLVMGGYEPNPVPWANDGIPHDFNFKLLDADFDHFAPTMELAMGRVPALQTAGINELINGPESFTPDGNFILGEAPELKNFFVGAGFNAFGIAAGGGAGHGTGGVGAQGRRAVRPVGRRHPPLRSAAPGHRLGAHAHARGLRQALHDGLAVRGARQRPTVPPVAAVLATARGRRVLRREARMGATQLVRVDRPRRDRARRVQLRAAELVRRRRSRAPRRREACVLIDQTSFAKFALKGPDALAALNWICCEQRRQAGRLADLHADARRLRWNPVRPHRVPGGRRRVLHRHRHRLRDSRLRLDPAIDPRRDERAAVRHHVGQHGAVADGPDCRATSCRRSRVADVSNEAFPFGTQQVIGIAGCPVRALRVTYVGELGWELHLPVEYATTVYDALMAGRRAHGADQRRLSGDREPATGEGLPGVGQRHRSRPHADRGRARVGGEAAQRRRVSRPRRSRRATRRWRAQDAGRVHLRPGRSCCSAARRSTATASESAG